MISLALSAALVAAAPNSADLYHSYASCVEGVIRVKLGDGIDPSAFDGQLPSACPAEAAAYKSALVQKELVFGVEKATAEAAANDEISSFVVDMKRMYRDAFAKHSAARQAAAATAAPAAPPTQN